MTITTLSTTFAQGASLSSPVLLPGVIVGVVLPATWVSAPISGQASGDGGLTYTNAFDDSGNEITLLMAAPGYNSLLPNDFPAGVWVTLRSGTSGAPVMQTNTGGVSILLQVLS